MINLIIKLFIDNKERTQLERRTRIGTVGGAVGIAANILLALAKAIVGLLFSSIATIADAVNNLTDAASSLITLVGFKLAAKKPDADHPYGHGRLEYITGLIMAFAVLMLGLSLAKDSFLQIIKPEPMEFSYVSIVVLVLAVFAKFWLSRFFKRLYKITESSAFSAASADSRNDVIITLSVIISLVIFRFFNINVDGVAGFIVAVVIIVSGVGLVKETLDPLLGQPPSKEFVEAIYKKTLGYEGIIGIHDLVVHNYGPGRIFVSLHAEVSAKEDIMNSHDLVDNIERDFKEDMNIEVTIHIDPIVVDDPYVNTLRSDSKTILSQIDLRLSMHDFRAVTGPTHTNIIFDVVLPDDILAERVKSEFDEKMRLLHSEVNSVITFDNSYI